MKACTTQECRSVIEALNAKKLAKLQGACALLGKGGPSKALGTREP